MKKYSQNHVVSQVKGEKTQIDGIAEVWYDDLESFRAFADIYQSSEGNMLRHAEENFIDKGETVSFLTEEKVIVKR